MEIEKKPGVDDQPHLAGASGADDVSIVIEHSEELPPRFGLLSLTGLGLLIGTVWPASGGSIEVAIFNGGPPGVIYQFITVTMFYFAVTASLAELASGMPSSSGVYLWASVTPGKSYGRPIGFFAGWWNYLGWICGAASMAFIWSNSLVQIYALKHDDYTVQPTHVFITFIISTWLACFLVCFCSRAMPSVNNFGIYWLLAGFVITVIVLAVLPGQDGRAGHASSSFVWTDWQADSGWPDGIVFLTGMLNAAYSVGCPAAVSHVAEEMPSPGRNVPIAMGLQIITGFVTGLCYLVALMYSINDYQALFESSFPIAEIYLQATHSANGAICLLILMQICIGLSLVGLYITSGRALWTLSRDGATPFRPILSRINSSQQMPINATIASAALVTLLGCIYLGNQTAFNAFVGSYVLMSSSSYIAAILPHLLTRRQNVPAGWFSMGRVTGFLVNAIAACYMIFAFVIYCLPTSLPVTATNMNYACAIWGGMTLVLGIYWLYTGHKGFLGPADRVRDTTDQIRG